MPINVQPLSPPPINDDMFEISRKAFEEKKPIPLINFEEPSLPKKPANMLTGQSEGANMLLNLVKRHFRSTQEKEEKEIFDDGKDESYKEKYDLKLTQPWQDYFNLQWQRMTDIINYINTL